MTGPEPLQGRLGKLKGLALLRAGADLADQDGAGPELRLMAGALRALARRALSPVSYTHLDVYKRQVWVSLS